MHDVMLKMRIYHDQINGILLQFMKPSQHSAG